MIGTVMLAAALSSAISWPADSKQVPHLVCSTVVGCEVNAPGGELLIKALSSADSIATNVLADGELGPVSIVAKPGAPGDRGVVMIRTSRRTYHVYISGSDTQAYNIITFTPPQPPPPAHVAPPAPIATAGSGPNSEIDPIQVSDMDFGWRMSGDSALHCVALFSVAPRGQLFCKLPSRLGVVPSVYLEDGKLDEPLNVHVVGGRYLVIDSLGANLRVEIPGHSMLIERTWE